MPATYWNHLICFMASPPIVRMSRACHTSLVPRDAVGFPVVKTEFTTGHIALVKQEGCQDDEDRPKSCLRAEGCRDGSLAHPPRRPARRRRRGRPCGGEPGHRAQCLCLVGRTQ